MAAFAFENPNKVWQRVRVALSYPNTTTTTGSAAFIKILDALKLFLATQSSNPDLGFYPFISTSVDDANGQLLATGAAKVVAVYAAKAATATDVYLHAIDDVDDDSTVTTKSNLMMSLLDSGDRAVYINPRGVAFALGLVMKAYTTPPGVTDSTDTDCPNGFVIVRQ